MSAPAWREEYEGLEIYRRTGRAAPLDLSDNTNRFGPAPSALAAFAAWPAEAAARYPTPGNEALREALAAWCGVPPDAIVTGCGSNDVLDAGFRALGRAGGVVAVSVPTFVMAPHFAVANGARVVPVPARPDGSPDVEALLAVGADVTYLASPDNPSGVATDPATLDRLLDRATGFVILDEAYVEFAGGSRATEAVARGNVLVTRTFSKAWGLAGLRVGYGIGAPRLVEEVEKARGPFKVNAIAERAAAAAVRNDQAWLSDIVDKTSLGRVRLTAGLGALGYDTFRSAANFVSVRVPDAAAASAALDGSGIGVRGFTRVPVLGDVVRITIGPDAEVDAVLDAWRTMPAGAAR